MRFTSVGAKVLGAVLAVVGLFAFSTSASAAVTTNPQTVAFGTVTVGTTSAAKSITISNSSTRRTVTVNASVSSSQFIYSGSSSFTLKPQQSLSVGVSFRPASAQSFSGALNFVTSSGTTISVSLSGAGASAQPPPPPSSGITLTIDPASISLAPGAKQTFIASAHGGNNTGITWTATCGSFTTDGWYGFYTAPASGSCSITGSMTANSSVKANAAVTVTGSTVTMPSITSQPVSKTITAGQTAAFAITASGSAMSYQWKKNGAAISGATSSSYTTPAATMSDNGAQFSCTVSNSAGSMNSSAATLTVNAAAVAPSISSQPVSKSVIAGQTASFTVSVTGTSPFTYQWTRNGAAISGANSSSYTTPATTTADNGAQFAVSVSNAAGSATSSPAVLTVTAQTFTMSANPSSMSFGSVNVGTSSSQQVTLSNNGTGSVTISGMSVNGAGFTASGVSSGQILSPGQTATINVNFQPSASGSINGSVNVSSNASAVVIALSGSGAQTVSHAVQLSWTRSTSTVNGYQVYSSQAAGGPYSRVTSSPVSLPNYTDSSVQNGKTYYYVVTAVDATGTESNYSNQASAAIPQ